MGKLYDGLDDRLTAFIAEQRLFFVATAPTSLDGHLNLSPKGLDTFRVLGPRTVAYLDLTGSGVETIAHLRENGRIVVMFTALEGAPRILRLYGRGEIVGLEDERFAELSGLFPAYESCRAIIRIEVERIADSCGFGVPRYRWDGDREELLRWARNKGREGVAAYRAERNRASIDGLPGLELPTEPQGRPGLARSPR